jgi:hypothetical protein
LLFCRFRFFVIFCYLGSAFWVLAVQFLKNNIKKLGENPAPIENGTWYIVLMLKRNPKRILKRIYRGQVLHNWLEVKQYKG